ncbi:ogr/Delta-like zinc finger family protein [Pusillimonas sp. NJUB218]|uniref:ogr/Delta-like zinc finger family protein n=1 Tax=Pusillimonas sp. NJUB218 TaxID=2023230 RepID=UPI000F4C0E4A|nr:ogr/Delta-like zinc finger family protein [Pusillimonas sp. NJUB218]ROT46095.1 hypothetical protein CHR62_03715 [Pusillimonas sp. NJUB218]
MSKRIGMRCPHCGNRAQIRTSIEQSPTMRDVYFLCENLTCGHSWVATLEAVRTIAPSGMPNPKVDLPILTRPEVERVYDLLNPSDQRSIFDE